MKICFVMPYHILENIGGGAEVQAWLMAKELARRGLHVSYICQNRKKRARRIEIIDGVLVRWVRYARHFFWSNGLEYFRALMDINPDVIVQRMTSFITGVVGFYTKIMRKKFIWICTDNSSPQKWIFLKNQLKTNRTYRINYIKSVVFIFNALICDVFRQWGMKKITYAFTQNDNQRIALKKSFFLDSMRIQSGHESPDLIMPSEKKLENKIVLWVANLGSNKQPEKFIQLARLAQETNLSFIMIGSKEERGQIRKLYNNLPNNLRMLGRLSFEETLRWFDQATFFVNTSRQEGFPNTFIQAWLRGLPVLTLNVDPDRVISTNGLGFVALGIGELLNKLVYLSNHSDEYRRISDRVKEYANRNYLIEKITDDFIKFI